MPRKNLIRSNRYPYHITARANNKELFHLDLATLWELVNRELYLTSILYGLQVHAFVLMPNHFHLIASTPEHDLGIVMQFFMKNLTKAINQHTQRCGRVFGERYFWSLITSTRYYSHAFKYVYRNPVRAQICKDVEEYEFSTLRGLLGLNKLDIPLHYTRIGAELNVPSLEDDHDRFLKWLNLPFPKELETLIQKSLRRKVINALKSPTTRRIDNELNQLF